MSSSSSSSPASGPVKISYPALLSDPASLLPSIARAFGSEEGCLGIILIEDLPPSFPNLRSNLFHLAQRFATLPEPVRERYARPDTSYMFGWSHGKEVMNGRPDTQKGSFYANPLIDEPEVTSEQRAAHPEYYAGNVWPRDLPEMQEYEHAFKALGKLIYEVGIALADACAPFVASSLSQSTSIASLISGSKSNKARLLHYYPESASSSSMPAASERVANDALCGTHLDHSLLTGLCSAMYLDQPEGSAQPTIVPPPTTTAGLYIYPRHASSAPRPDALKVSIPTECLAFQTGEALELLTAGRLAATPHFVSGNAAASNEGSTVSRETFAFFLQPDVDDVIGPDGETFGAFTKRVLGRHYAEAPQEAED
ncbi:hypothetical protein EHS25_009598 [Saitozyma podzolica]|uniref:Non-haem dioxygenase N-terminal domain-containing protein n=1 Tax=Saitozyma podzolica TaxID=1890683 RepID=A0A427YJQ6_9TREE|nr:hypothetical protein EHS25_009598 [Saitozyma podzolica]